MRSVHIRQRCSDSRSGPEKHRWMTVYLQKCSTLCHVIDKIGRDELNRTLINEGQRLRQTMNLNGCAAVQCTSRVSSHTPGVDVSCAMPGSSATGTGSEKPKGRGRGLAGLRRPRAPLSTPQKNIDHRLPDRALNHQNCHVQLTIELRKLVLAFLFQVRCCEQV